MSISSVIEVAYVTEPNELCAPIHNRMPAIVDPADYPKWLGEQPATNDELHAMLKPFPAECMEAFKIGLKSDNVKCDEPD